MAATEELINVGDTDALAELAGSGNRFLDAKARAGLSPFPAEMEKWINAELDRGTDARNVMLILTMIMLDTIASVAAQTINPTSDSELAKLVKRAVDRDLVSKIAKVRAHLAARKAEGAKR